MKTISQILVLLFLFSSSSVAGEVVNRVILRVNDRIATLYDYERRRAERIVAMQQQDLSAEDRQRFLEETGKEVMREIFDELLILSRADQLSVTVGELQIDEAIDRMKENAKITTEEELRLALAQSGMTLSSLRQQVTHRLMFDEVMGREVYSRITIEEEELRRYYQEHEEDFRLPEQVQLKEIVVLEDQNPDSQALKDLAGEIRSALVAGRSLDELATEHEGKVSPVIDVGWVSPGELDPALEQGVWELKVGEISQPIEARGGLHLCQILGRRESTLKPFADVQNQIMLRERQRKFQGEVDDYLKELEEQSFIRGQVPDEAQGFLTATGRSVADDGIPLLEAPSAPEGGIPEPSSSPSEETPP